MFNFPKWNQVIEMIKNNGSYELKQYNSIVLLKLDDTRVQFSGGEIRVGRVSTSKSDRGLVPTSAHDACKQP